MIRLKPSKIVTLTIETKNDMAFYTSEMEAERTAGKSNFEKNGIFKFFFLLLRFLYFDPTKFAKA